MLVLPKKQLHSLEMTHKLLLLNLQRFTSRVEQGTPPLDPAGSGAPSPTERTSSADLPAPPPSSQTVVRKMRC